MRRSLLLSRIPTVPFRRILPSHSFRHPAVILSTLPRFRSSTLAVPTHVVEVDSHTTSTTTAPSPPRPTLAALRTAQGPLVRYDSLVEAGTLLNDDFQRVIVSKLQDLHDELEGYYPPPIPEEVPTGGAGGGGFVSSTLPQLLHR